MVKEPYQQDGVVGRMRVGSYNRKRAANLRELARQTSSVEHRQSYLRLAFQYDAIADLEAARPLGRVRKPRMAEPILSPGHISLTPCRSMRACSPITRSENTPAQARGSLLSRLDG